MIEEQVHSLIADALAAAAPELGLSGELPEVELSRPRQKEHGDYATNIALVIASRPGVRRARSPSSSSRDLPLVAPVRSAEVAGPGFINFRLTDGLAPRSVLREIADRGAAYGRAEPTGRRVQVEFVSANPTGPLHVGHARNAALGDALARLFEATGLVGRARVLLQRRGRADGPVRRVASRPGISARSGERGGAGGRVPRRLHRRARPGHPGGRTVRVSPTSRLPSAWRGSDEEGATRALAQIGRDPRALRRPFDVYLPRASLEEKGEIAAAVERLPAAGARVRGRGRGLVPLHGVRRRQGSPLDPFERPAHVLRRRRRVRDRQVRARLRPPRLRLGRGPPRAMSPASAAPRRRSATTPAASRS